MKTTSLVRSVCLLWGVFFFGATALGGDGRGNGGIVLICDATGVGQPPMQLFDFYEGRELRSVDRDLGNSELTYPQKISLALARLERLDPERAQRYAHSAGEFESQALIKHGITLTPLDDAFPIFIPRGCRIEQAVNQQQPMLSTDYRYIVNRDIWERLDADNLAGLVLHEVIYGDAIRLGQKDSRATRAFNQYLTSHKLEQMNADQYKTFLREIGFLPSTQTGEEP